MLAFNKSPKKTQKQSEQQDGFTIVELLIVVVVIAILAAITIVSYNGIQNRAHVAATASNIKTYVNGLEMMKTIQGGYYKGDGGLGITGETSGSITYEGDRCVEYGVTPGTTNAPVGAFGSAFNQALLPYLGSIPKQSVTKATVTIIPADGCNTILTSGAPYYFGVKKIVIANNDVSYTLYAPADTSTTAEAFAISYSLPGDVNCFVGNNFKKYYPEYGYTECYTFGGNVVRQ